MSSANGNSSNRTAVGAKRPRLSDILNRHVAAYVVAAGAAGVTVAAMAASAETPQGPIVFTPANVSLGGLGSTHFNIDLNHDGIPDFTLEVTNTRWVSSGGGGNGARGSFWEL